MKPLLSADEYVDKVRGMFPEPPAGKEEVAYELMARLADVLLMMDDCRRHLDKEGCASVQSRGTYTIIKENPYSRIYDSKHKLMLATVDKLVKLYGSDVTGPDELMDFIDNG